MALPFNTVLTAATADLDGAWSSPVLDASVLKDKLFRLHSTANVALTVKLMSLPSATATNSHQVGSITLGDGSVTATEDEIYLSDYHPYIRFDVTSGGAAGSGSLVITVLALGAQ